MLAALVRQELLGGFILVWPGVDIFNLILMCLFTDLGWIHLYRSKTPHVEGKVSPVVNLDTVKVVLTLYQTCPPMGPFNPLFFGQLTALRDGSMVDLFSMLICH